MIFMMLGLNLRKINLGTLGILNKTLLLDGFFLLTIEGCDWTEYLSSKILELNLLKYLLILIKRYLILSFYFLQITSALQ